MMKLFFKTRWFEGFLAVLFLSFILQPVIAETPQEKKVKEAKSNMKGVAAAAAIGGLAAGGIAVLMGAPIIAGVAVAVGVGVLGGIAVKAGLKAIDFATKKNQQQSQLENAINAETMDSTSPFDENGAVNVK